MSMTMTQKILAKHAGLDSVVAGQLIEAKLDMVLGNDVTSPVAINEMTKFGKNSVFDRTKISLVMDHFTPNKDIQSAQNCKQVREFAKKYDITHYYDVGNMGIEHALLPEQGVVTCGDCIMVPTLILAHTVRSVLFQQALAQPIWQLVWLQVKLGLRFRLQLRL